MARRNKVGIVGAGKVGATFAYTMELMGTAREIVLVDRDRERAEGEVMDLNHGLPFVPPVDIRAGDYPDLADSDLVVVTAGSPRKLTKNRLDLVGANVEVVREVVRSLLSVNYRGLLLMVSNPVDVLTYVALKESGFDPQRVFGSGTVLDSARFRFLLSRRCGVDSRNIHASIVGEHGDSEVALWSTAQLGGMPLGLQCVTCNRPCDHDIRTGLLDQVRRSAYHIVEAKGATNWAVSLALERIVRAVLRDERSILTVSRLVPDGLYGLNDVCLGLPTLVSANGAERVLDVPISDEEKKALALGAEVLQKVIREVYPG